MGVVYKAGGQPFCEHRVQGLSQLGFDPLSDLVELSTPTRRPRRRRRTPDTRYASLRTCPSLLRTCARAWCLLRIGDGVRKFCRILQRFCITCLALCTHPYHHGASLHLLPYHTEWPLRGAQTQSSCIHGSLLAVSFCRISLLQWWVRVWASFGTTSSDRNASGQWGYLRCQICTL